MKDLIREITGISGPSSYEEKVAEYIIKRMKKIKGISIKKDVMGNVIIRKPGKGKKIMLAAHMDEIGFMIKHIDKNGFLRFSIVGGIFPINIIHSNVEFMNGLTGIIGFEEKDYDYKKLVPLNKMYIDIGAKDKKQAEKMVKIGDFAVMKQMFCDMGNRISSKAMDDRVGCAMLIKLLEMNIKTNNDIYFVFTSQEEVGVRGAKTSAYEISPDFAIAVDVTSVGDTPSSEIMEVSLGNGPTIKIKDQGIVVRKDVIDLMVKAAEKNKIPYQREILENGATDAYAIHMTKSGVLTGVVSIPTRYIHSKAEMLDLNDVENGIKLIKAIIEGDLKELKC